MLTQNTQQPIMSLLQGQGTGEFMRMMPMLVIMFLIFYFLLIRPQNKERREQEQMRATLKKGDKVLTQGGIIAKVQQVKETEILLDLDGSSRLRVAREAIIRVLNESVEGKKAEKAEKAA